MEKLPRTGAEIASIHLNNYNYARLMIALGLITNSIVLLSVDNSPKQQLYDKWKLGELTLEEVKSNLDILRSFKLKKD